MKAQRVIHLLGTLLLMPAAIPAVAQQTAPVKPAAAPSAAAAAPKETRPAWVRKADKGFFDDPLALHPGLGLLALIRTDSASFAQLELFDLVKKTKLTSFPLGDSQQIFERIVFTGDDRSLLVVVRDGKTGQRSAQRFDHDGKPAGLLGPATDIGFASRGDSHFIVRWDQSQDKKRATQFVVATHDLKDFAPVGKARVFTTEATGDIVNPPLKVLSWTHGYTRILGQEPGAYDKAKDMRMPNRAAVYDVLRGEFLWRQEIGDVLAWARVNELGRRRPGRSAFAEIAEDQSALDLVDGAGAKAPLRLAVPFEMYDLRSLLEQESEGRLSFSLTVDPLNPEALSRKKADVPKLDLYQVARPEPGALADGSARPAQHVLRAPMDDRPVKWITAGSWVLLLRKFKSFARGGDVLEVYKLP